VLDKFLKVGCLASLLVLVLWVAPTFAADAPTLQSVSDAVKSAQVSADTAYMLICSALVLFMTPGLAFFYGGFVAKRNILNTLMMSFLLMGIVGVSWVLWGYSLAFDPGNPFIGSFDWFGLNKVGLETSGYLKAMPELSDPAAAALDSYAATVPHQVFMIYQAMFAIITPALISGAIVERTSFTAYSLFVLLWSTFIYSPMAHMVWAKGGFFGLAGGLGALDFAGGTVVHIASGVSALTAAMFLGPRKSYPDRVAAPHNVPFILLGAGMLWFGWFGFNAGSALGANAIAGLAFINTQVATAGALLGWVLTEKFRDGHPTSLGAASGAVAGLVAITPACAFVVPWAAVVIGFIAGVICALAVGLKYKFGFDDALDVVGVHLVGGIVGSLAIGFFGSSKVNSLGLDGLFYGGGATLLGKQALGVGLVMGYSFVMTLIIGFLIEKTIGFRVKTENELAGVDLSEHAESAYEMGGNIKGGR